MSDRIKEQILLARFALLWERLWRAAWPAVAVIGLALSIALFDLLPDLPGWLHGGIVLAAMGALVVAVWHGFRDFRWPRGAEARRRLERESALAHRPLAVLDDSPAGIHDDAPSAAIWLAHRERALAALRRLRPGWPSPGVAGLDPWALRAVPILTLAVALIAAWGEIGDRLSRAAQPALAGAAAAAPTLQLWITPPKYTALAPRFIDATKTTGALSVPDGSMFMAQLHGGWGRPRLRLGGRRIDFRPLAGKSFEAKAKLDRSGRLRITQRGRVLARLDITLIPDRPPVIEFWKPPARTRRAALSLAYDATDDYGITGIKATIRRRDPGKDKTKLIELDLPLPGADQKKVRATSYHDLTAHRWAGLAVEVQFVATDARGQTGRTEAFTMVLPERLFMHPVARAIVAQRKRLTENPDQRRDVARMLGDLTVYPKRFFDDIVVYMALRSARARLNFDKSDKAVREVQDLLWDTALRIEDGKLSLAERELREAQRALAEALARGADSAEIERLLDRLQQALDFYLRALAKDMETRPEKYGATKRQDLNELRLQGSDLQRLIDRLRETARSGSRDAARQMLSQLQELLENLRATARRGGRQSKGEHPASRLLRDLQGLIGNQHKLLDQTFRQSQRQLGSPGLAPEMKRGAARQGALRRQLGGIMRRLGEMTGKIPRALGQAERSMRDATGALRRRIPGQAARAQGKALDSLRRGGRAAAEALSKKFAGQMGRRPGQGRQGRDGRGPGRDPLGRPFDGAGNFDRSSVKIPDRMELQKAREILNELRRRAGESQRPHLEREYIDRLLRRF